MDYYTMVMILGIMFWVLCALGIVAGLAWVYCYVQYYKWDKEDRYKSSVVKEIQETIKQTLEELDKEQYDEFEDEPSGGN